MAIITISRQVGSLGDEVAERLAKELNYRYFDKFLMTEIAVSSGLSEEEVVDFSEENYKIRSFFEQLFKKREPVAKITKKIIDEKGGTTLTTQSFDEEGYLLFVQQVIKKLKEWDNVVIVGRGGQVLLRDIPNVLHVRIVAPFENRIENLMKERNIPREEAIRIISEKDRATEAYLRRFYNIDWNDPCLYHLVLNMGMISVDKAVEIIKSTLRIVT